MRDIFGTIFAICILLAILFLLVDTSTWQMKPTTRNDVIAVFGLAFIGILGFAFLTGRGLAEEPRPPKYDH